MVSGRPKLLKRRQFGDGRTIYEMASNRLISNLPRDTPACPRCNLHKADKTITPDPLTSAQVALFHPLQQRWSEHFRFKGHEVEGLTAIGRATVELLDLNHLRRQRIRQVEQSFGLYPPTR